MGLPSFPRLSASCEDVTGNDNNNHDDSIISQSAQYIHNWNGHHVKVDVSDDEININLEDKEYKFSKKRFLSNRNFQRDVIDEYSKAYGNVYLRFFQKKNEDDKYTIHVKAGR